MSSIEAQIGDRKYVLSSDDDESHLSHVAEIVAKKVESLQKERPSLSLQKASILAAFDFASLLIKGNKKGMEYRAEALSKAHHILEQVQSELSSQPN